MLGSSLGSGRVHALGQLALLLHAGQQPAPLQTSLVVLAPQRPAASWAVDLCAPWHSWQFYLMAGHIQRALQCQSLHGPMQALTLWQQEVMQAAIARAQARLSVLADAWSSGVGVSEQRQHEPLLGEVLQCAGLPVCSAAVWNA